mgnify:FL=1
MDNLTILISFLACECFSEDFSFTQCPMPSLCGRFVGFRHNDNADILLGVGVKGNLDTDEGCKIAFVIGNNNAWEYKHVSSKESFSKDLQQGMYRLRSSK